VSRCGIVIHGTTVLRSWTKSRILADFRTINAQRKAAMFEGYQKRKALNSAAHFAAQSAARRDPAFNKINHLTN